MKEKDIEQIKKWWDKPDSGPRNIIRNNNSSSDCEKQQNNMNFKNPHHKNYVGQNYKQDGIMLGNKWGKLNKKEKDMVINAYQNANKK
jgi:hypothetical protein